MADSALSARYIHIEALADVAWIGVQYAIPALVFEDFERADRYVEFANSLAKRQHGHDTHQIDNHYESLLLEKARGSSSKEEVCSYSTHVEFAIINSEKPFLALVFLIEEHVLLPDGQKSGEILEPGGTEFATRAGGARRHRKALGCLRWCDLMLLFSDSVDGWTKHKAPRLGAALAFYTLLSLTPLLLVAISIVGLVFGRTLAERQIVQQIQPLVGSQAANASEALLKGTRNTTHGVIATIVGSVTLLFGASGVLIELRDALNTIWEVPAVQLSGVKKITSFIKQRLFSFAIVLSIGFLLVVSLAISAWIAALGQRGRRSLNALGYRVFEALLRRGTDLSDTGNRHTHSLKDEFSNSIYHGSRALPPEGGKRRSTRRPCIGGLTAYGSAAV